MPEHREAPDRTETPRRPTAPWRRFSRAQARGVVAALFVSLIGAGFSARALSPLETTGAVGPPPARGYEADDHFPGAAYFTSVEDSEAVIPGATGTAPLPDAPAGLESIADPTLRAAPPFRLAGSSTDRARALQCLTTAIYYEAANEPDAGQRAVAQVVLNRVRHPAFPATVCGVVFQGSDRRGCQFSFACDGSMRRLPSATAWTRARRVAEAELNGQVFAPVGMATHYHTYAVTPAWNRGLVMTGVFGAHFFHRWKGYWGTPAAFSQRYRGGEPVPGPLAPVAAEPVAPIAIPLVAPTPAPHAAATAGPSAMRDTAGSGPPPPQALPESDVLPRWRDSGQPLR